MTANTHPTVEPVTDEDYRMASAILNGDDLWKVLTHDRRRVAERQADGLKEAVCRLTWCRAEIERLRAEVARLTAALNGKENSDAS